MEIIEMFKVIGITFINVLYAVVDLIIQLFPLAYKINSIPKEGLALILGIPTICLSIILFSFKFLLKRIK